MNWLKSVASIPRPDNSSLFFFTLILILFIGTSSVSSTHWQWELANGLGLSALATLLYLSSAKPPLCHVNFHQHISYCAAILIFIHALFFIFIDTTVINYLTISAPIYMWSGSFAFLLIIILVISSISANRKKSYSNYITFKKWHKFIAWPVLATTFYHILGSGFYLGKPIGIIVFCLFAIPFIWPKIITLYITTSNYPVFYFWILAIGFAGLFTALKHLPL